jgi:hypothetical protein
VHGRIHGAVLMSVLQNMESVCRTWVIVSDVTNMFWIAELRAPARLAYVLRLHAT